MLFLLACAPATSEAQLPAVAPNGLAEGEAIGPRLAEAGWAHVHLVAHSVGGMVVDGALGALPTDRSMTVHATFLDPFCFLSVFEGAYGNRHFGEGADFAESYLDDDDPAPSTGDPLDHAHTFNVTGVRPSTIDAADGHRWPITWYQESWADGTMGAAWSAEVTGALNPALADTWPPGEVTDVE